jgi:hypothetical protein
MPFSSVSHTNADVTKRLNTVIFLDKLLKVDETVYFCSDESKLKMHGFIVYGLKLIICV